MGGGVGRDLRVDEGARPALVVVCGQRRDLLAPPMPDDLERLVRKLAPRSSERPRPSQTGGDDAIRLRLASTPKSSTPPCPNVHPAFRGRMVESRRVLSDRSHSVMTA